VNAADRLAVLPPVLPCLTMAQREKRSVSLPPELAQAIDQAAADDGTTFSAWLAEHDHGPLTPDELADGLARARALLGRPKTKRPSRRSA
jgi:hypothetical protein